MKATNKKLRPSAAARWLACPGSIAMVDKMEAQGLETDKESAPAVGGTRAHAYAEARLKSMFYPVNTREGWAEEAEKIKPLLTPDLLANAEQYVAYVTGFLFGQTEE